jgi:hypothetical protein
LQPRLIIFNFSSQTPKGYNITLPSSDTQDTLSYRDVPVAAFRIMRFFVNAILELSRSAGSLIILNGLIVLRLGRGATGTPRRILCRQVKARLEDTLCFA